jgi:TPR repeat protein
VLDASRLLYAVIRGWIADRWQNQRIVESGFENPIQMIFFVRAGKQADNGNLKSAFRLFLAAAKAGDSSCQINLGNFYDEGTGIRRNRSAAM